MLPAQHKLTSPRQFRRTIKGGRRAGTRTVVVHLRFNDGEDDIAATGPRLCMSLMREGVNGTVLPANVDIVIRALPASGSATSERLERDIRKALSTWDI